MEKPSPTSHLSFNASGNSHLPGDFSGDIVTCNGCDFSGTRWEFLEHLHILGVCWSCHGRGIFKFRIIPTVNYDHVCRKCGGTGIGQAPLPPKPEETHHDLKGRPTTQ